MLRRIYGIETEYGITFSLRGQRRLSPDEVSRFLFRKVVAWGRSSNVFLENGSRLYLDVGSHPEYATAECDTLVDAVAQDKAGESILRELVEYAQGQLSDEGIRGDIYLFKNNTDSTGNSYGCHENYCIERIDDLTRLEQVFIPYLISRQIFTGAGKVVTNAKGTAYSMSQRAEHIWEAISSATTRSRPIINTRDEPHADPEKYRRLHVIVGDSNMSEFATYLKLGTAAVVLAMIEDRNTVLRDYNMASPINALRDISYDLWSKEPVKLTNGRDLTALEIQDDLCERAEQFLQGHPLPADQVHAVTTVARGDRAVPQRPDGSGRPRRLDRQVADHRARARAQRRRAERPQDRPHRPAVPRHELSSAVSTTAVRRAGTCSASSPTRRSRRRRTRHRRPRARTCAARSSRPRRSGVATTPSTGSTSSSTTRCSAPCC